MVWKRKSLDLGEVGEEDRANKDKMINRKRFAILMDYENLRKHLERKRFDDFSWLLDSILKQGDIVRASVFMPDYLSDEAPLKTLSNIHRFFCVVCPKRYRSTTVKDVDTVDHRLTEEGDFLIEHTDITDLVIVAGDADYHALITKAKWHNKRVLVISAADAISGRLLFDDTIPKVIVS